jgi:plastocyanin
MRKSLIVAVIVIIVLIGGALALANKSNNNKPTASQPAATSSQSNSSSSSNASAAPGKVEITNNMIFTPSQISVSVGSSVTWTNNDNVSHTVVEDHGDGPNSGEIAPGATYSYTFTKKGSYQYHCSIHPQMRGTIVVK